MAISGGAGQLPIRARFPPRSNSARAVPLMRPSTDAKPALLATSGLLQELRHKQPLTHIPPPTAEHTATPCGLLANELVHAPGPLLATLGSMLARALDLDSGAYGSSASNVILYMLRLVSRVAEYAGFVVQNSEYRRQVRSGAAMPCNGGWKSHVRGLGREPGSEGYEEWVREVWSAREQLRLTLVTKAYAMLESWRLRLLKVGHVLRSTRQTAGSVEADVWSGMLCLTLMRDDSIELPQLPESACAAVYRWPDCALHTG
eukprot:3710705-Rhodomonas_salina.3